MSKKYYAVRIGREPGIYETWEECQAQTKGFPKAQFKSFELRSQAEDFMQGIDFAGSKNASAKFGKSLFEDKPDIVIETVPQKQIQNELPIKLPDEITIYTDGSCINNTNDPAAEKTCGGWAAVILDATGTKELCRLEGGAERTTNIRMEMEAVKNVLDFVSGDGKRRTINLISDNQYIVNSINKRWIESWKQRGEKDGKQNVWIKADGEPVKNQDLWKAIDRLRRQHVVRFQHTYAHVGTKYNELCDQIAKEAAWKQESNIEIRGKISQETQKPEEPQIQNQKIQTPKIKKAEQTRTEIERC
jgi:ribonuclease HI